MPPHQLSPAHQISVVKTSSMKGVQPKIWECWSWLLTLKKLIEHAQIFVSAFYNEARIVASSQFKIFPMLVKIFNNYTLEKHPFIKYIHMCSITAGRDGYLIS